MILYYQPTKIGEVVKVKNKNGGVAKWLTAPDLKSDILERVSWVRILPPPQTKFDMMIQLNPMIPILRVSDGMEGYAFLVIDYSQEHNLLFTCAMDDGEIWTLSNHDIRFCKNISLDRNEIKL